ncbi:MAG: recombinase family protein, partial [Candidatus Cybelea sp.]
TLGYVRVSSESQAREGVSLDAQEARIAAYAVALGWTVSEVIRDAGCSAKDLRRPGIGKILDAIKRGVGGHFKTARPWAVENRTPQAE